MCRSSKCHLLLSPLQTHTEAISSAWSILLLFFTRLTSILWFQTRGCFSPDPQGLDEEAASGPPKHRAEGFSLCSASAPCLVSPIYSRPPYRPPPLAGKLRESWVHGTDQGSVNIYWMNEWICLFIEDYCTKWRLGGITTNAMEVTAILEREDRTIT